MVRMLSPASTESVLVGSAAMSSKGWMTSMGNTVFFCHRFSTRITRHCKQPQHHQHQICVSPHAKLFVSKSTVNHTNYECHHESCKCMSSQISVALQWPFLWRAAHAHLPLLGCGNQYFVPSYFYMAKMF